MDNLKAAKRYLDNAAPFDWQAGVRACAHALVAIAEKEIIDEFTATGNVYDLSDLHEKNRGLMDELDRMRSRLTQAHVEIGKLKAELREQT